LAQVMHMALQRDDPQLPNYVETQEIGRQKKRLAISQKKSGEKLR
jgi:hypothetical protein